MEKLMKNKVIFDGRNIYEPSEMQELGFTYYSIGRKTLIPK
jgi:UDPglucose 6-dehydrogenase